MPAPLFIPPHINCQNCGDCCGMIPAFPEEVDHIKLYLKQHPEIIEKARLQSHRSFNCPFRDNNEKKCMVYSVRPIVCRLMGVCNGMECKHGNSANIDGSIFLHGYPKDQVIILNWVDW